MRVAARLGIEREVKLSGKPSSYSEIKEGEVVHEERKEVTVGGIGVASKNIIFAGFVAEELGF
jgi:hypothetical protein